MVIVNVALVAPAGIVTLAGTDATAGLLLVNVTVAPPVGGPRRLEFAVPVDGVPPCTVVGLRGYWTLSVTPVDAACVSKTTSTQ